MQKVAIITGASQGIGQATAIRLANVFGALVLVARNLANLEKTAAAVRAAGAQALVIEADVSQPLAPAHIVEKALAAHGRIDALVNIAGAVPQIDLFDMSDQQWHDATALKLHGARRMTLAAWPALKASQGAVIMMSGNSAVTPKAASAAVATINAAIVALAKAFADRGIDDGIQVNSVLPGAVLTERRSAHLASLAARHGITVEEATLKFPRDLGIARLGSAEEIAGLMAFLLSPSARWMTGTALRMDGGEVKAC